MPQLTREQVIDALRTVNDPELHRDLVSLNMVRDVQLDDRAISLEIELTTPACPMKETLQRDIEQALAPLQPSALQLRWSAKVRTTLTQQVSPGSEPVLPDVKNVILVASGKGGVGKSTVAANLALALAQDGAKVGLLDADIYGPSIPIMFGIFERPATPDGKRIQPLHAHGVDLMSIGFFVSPAQAMIWRGPVLNGTIVQFVRDVLWGELDYLIVDLPPGTGDVQLSISQQLRVSGAVLVTTPQDVALADVIRGKAMFDQVKIPTLGIIENMSYFICNQCSARHEIFAHGGGRAAAEKLSIPFLGELPLVPAVREAGDFGMPVVAREKDAEIAHAFRQVARSLAGRLSVEAIGAQGTKKRIFAKIFT
ncbi:MAG: iron-sulfur cluster carrier protein ApbC [Myxococcota bacterium]